MEYTKKYPTAKPLEICGHGTLLKGTAEGPCTICGRLTAFVEHLLRSTYLQR